MLAAVWILPTHADDCITLPLGYGRTHAGPVGEGVGFDAYRLRTSDSPWYAETPIRRTGERRPLVSTQHHARMEGREIVRSATAGEFARNPNFATAKEDERIPDHTLYPDYPHDGYQWAMVIDLNACIGLFFLAFLSFSDLLTRSFRPAPWQPPIETHAGPTAAAAVFRYATDSFLLYTHPPWCGL